MPCRARAAGPSGKPPPATPTAGRYARAAWSPIRGFWRSCPGCGQPGRLTAGRSHRLFPAGQPGRPISSCQLNERLRQLGLHPGQDRSTTLFQLAAGLPAALLARMFGIHITAAVAWQRASRGDWTSYAAGVSRRTGAGMTPQPETAGP